MLIQGLPGNTCLYCGIHILTINAKNLVHVGHINAYATIQGGYVALKRCACAEGYHGNIAVRARFDYCNYLVGVLGKYHRIWRGRCMI